MMAATKGEYKAPKKKGRRSQSFPSWSFLPLVLFFGIFAFLNFMRRRRHFYSGGSTGWTRSGGFFGSGSSFGDSGGGFSGGGGDFGGGGASGNW
jgi:uncharacterized protein